MSPTTFNRESTVYDVASAFSDQITGKTIIITGVSPNGLGESMAHALAKHNPATLIFTARTSSKANAVVEALKRDNPGLKTEIHVVAVDLASPPSVRKAWAQIKTLAPSVDILINNAGVMALPERTLASETGVEMQLATNFLGHFQLTTLLAPQLQAAGDRARVVNVTSGGFRIQPFRFTDPNFDADKTLPPEEVVKVDVADKLGLAGMGAAGANYVGFLAYSQANTATMLLTRGLNEGYAGGKKILAFDAAPGVVVTELQRHLPSGFRNPNAFYKTADQGAASFLVAALDPSLEATPGAYVNEASVEETVEHVKSLELTQKLWRLAEGWLK